MRKFAAIAFGLALAGLISVPSGHVSAYTGEKLANGAKVSWTKPPTLCESGAAANLKKYPLVFPHDSSP